MKKHTFSKNANKKNGDFISILQMFFNDRVASLKNMIK